MVLSGYIRDGFIGLIAIDREKLSQHTPLSCNFTLPWKCEALAGTVEVLLLLFVILFMGGISTEIKLDIYKIAKAKVYR